MGLQRTIVVSFQRLLLHVSQRGMVKLEEMVNLYRIVPFGSDPYRPSQLLPLLLFLFLFTTLPHVTLRYELNINVLGKPLLSFGVRTNRILNTHSVDSSHRCRTEPRREILHLFHWFILMRKDVMDLIAKGVERLVVVEPVLSEMHAVDRKGRFWTGTI